MSTQGFSWNCRQQQDKEEPAFLQHLRSFVPFTLVSPSIFLRTHNICPFVSASSGWRMRTKLVAHIYASALARTTFYRSQLLKLQPWSANARDGAGPVTGGPRGPSSLGSTAYRMKLKPRERLRRQPTDPALTRGFAVDLLSMINFCHGLYVLQNVTFLIVEATVLTPLTFLAPTRDRGAHGRPGRTWT